MYRRQIISLLVIQALLLLLCSCASNPVDRKPFTDLYCDNYFVYNMCAKDIDHDGEVDLMYFEDTREIFMLSAEYEQAQFEEFSLHQCAQLMDDSIRHASNELLYLNKHSGSLHKTRIKSRLMLYYTRYLPTINRCMSAHGLAESSAHDDDFGDDDFDEL